MDRVEIFQSSDRDALGRLCPGGYVYNLEVEGTNNYFANSVLVHNCHHATAAGYLGVLGRCGFLANQGSTQDPRWVKHGAVTKPLIGLTATPGRGDGVGLHNVFDSILYQLKLQDAISQGWLVPIEAFTVLTGVNLDRVRTIAGDYVEKDLAREVDTAERNAAVFDACQRNAAGLKTLIFCVTVQHADDMAEHFRRNGRPAEFVSGLMNGDERRRKLDWFRVTRGAVLCNVAVLSEGTDIPSIECVTMAAPTKSKTRYCQAIGRGTRLADGAHDYTHSIQLGKSRLVLLDITDTTSRLGQEAVNIADIWGLPIRGITLTGERLELIELTQKKLIEQQAIERIQTLACSIDLFATAPAGSIPSSARLPWTYLAETEMRIMLPDREQVRITTDALDRWCVEWFDGSIWTPRLDPIPDKESACSAAEKLVRTWRADAIRLLAWQQSGSNKPPSDKQVAYAKRLGITIPEGCTAVQLSAAMNRAIASGRDRPSPRMIGYARRLGVHGAAQMTKGQLGRMINQSKAAKYPLDQT